MKTIIEVKNVDTVLSEIEIDGGAFSAKKKKYTKKDLGIAHLIRYIMWASYYDLMSEMKTEMAT